MSQGLTHNPTLDAECQAGRLGSNPNLPVSWGTLYPQSHWTGQLLLKTHYKTNFIQTWHKQNKNPNRRYQSNSSRNFLRGTVQWRVPGEPNTFKDFFFCWHSHHHRNPLKLHKLAVGVLTSLLLYLQRLCSSQQQQMKAPALLLHTFV